MITILFDDIKSLIDKVAAAVAAVVIPAMEAKLSALDDAISQLQADVTNLTTVDSSAVALINGIAAQIQAAVDAALANGATAAQLQSLTDLHASITSQDDALAAAVAANTPPPPPAP